jgi:ABC-type branched-subunit amino acid transport system ATPase component
MDTQANISPASTAIAESTPAPTTARQRQSCARMNLSPCILAAEGIKMSFGGPTVLDDVDLELRRGEVVLLRGENGSGKTTLLNILTGNLEPDSGTIHYLADDSPRSYQFPRRWWQELNPWDHFRPEFVAMEGIGRTWQDVRLFGSLSLRDNIAVAEPGQPGENPLVALLAPGRARKTEAHIRAEADTILARLGLDSRQTSSADMISLGQSKRVAIARGVAGGASILFLDEPLAGLDRQGIADILALLESLVRDRNLTLVIVEHVFNQHHLQGLVTTNWLLDKGKLTTNHIDSTATHARSDPASSRPGWFSLLAGPDATILDESLPHGALLTRIRHPDRFKNTAKPILEIKNLIVKRSPRTVIGLDDHGQPTGFNLTLHEGEIAILQAPNGWGKSTLFAAIAGLIPTDAGEIRLQDQSLAGLSAWERVRSGLRMLPSGQHTFPNLTGQESLRLAGTLSVPIELAAFAARSTSSYSGGQKQRLALAAMTPSMVNVYDEPMAALDAPEPFLRRCLVDNITNQVSLVLLPSAAVQGRINT